MSNLKIKEDESENNTAKEDESLVVEFMRHCSSFIACENGKPSQVFYSKGSVHSLKRSVLNNIFLQEIVPVNRINDPNLHPKLYVIRGSE